MKAIRIERTGEKQLLVTSTHGEDILCTYLRGMRTQQLPRRWLL